MSLRDTHQPRPGYDDVDYWRESHALELTRANALETALRKAEVDRDQWQKIALENGDALDRVSAERTLLARDVDLANIKIGNLQYHLREAEIRIGAYSELLVDIYEASRHYKATAKTIEDLIDRARGNSKIFESCSYCGGGGEERSSFSHEFGSTPTVDDCPECNGLGSVFR